jgi:hypothetical protein
MGEKASRALENRGNEPQICPGLDLPRVPTRPIRTDLVLRNAPLLNILLHLRDSVR